MGFSDLLFPPRCGTCRDFIGMNSHMGFCRKCMEGFIKLYHSLCTVCGRTFEAGDEDHVCGTCALDPPSFKVARSPYVYDESAARAIAIFKYNFRRITGKKLGKLLAAYLDTPTGLQLEFNTVIPVPLHPKRLRWRGFNQSLILAKFAADKREARLDIAGLKRIRFTQPQTELKPKERMKNVKNAFEVVKPYVFRDRDVLIVDDVYTTGATANECAKAITKAEARSVSVLTMARV